MRRWLGALLLVAGCSLNPQPLPPDERSAFDGDGGAQTGNQDAAMAPHDDASTQLDAGSDATQDAAQGMDAGDAGDGGDAGDDAGDAGDGGDAGDDGGEAGDGSIAD